jgi:hypothetical protein
MKTERRNNVSDLTRYAIFDAEGLLKPREPFSWETLARVAVDLANARLMADTKVTASPIEWDQDGGYQWTDRHYGFSIIEEPGDDKPYCATWGESDGEQFATLAEARAWCQDEIDRWIARYAVLTPNVALSGARADADEASRP